MKKVLSIALALVMILSLSVTAFADSYLPISDSGDIEVQAKIVPMISAQVDWGDMQFTYYEQGTFWDANGTNRVSVTNTSLYSSIDTSYSYAQYNGKGETTMTAGWVEDQGTISAPPSTYDVTSGDYSGSYMGTISTRPLELLGTTLGTGDSQQFWLTFTTNLYVSTLTQSFAQVGNLTVTIAAH